WNTAANGYGSYFIRDTNDAKAGVHAAYIKGFGAQSYSVQGAALGTCTMNARPVSLTGWYKCNIVPNDSLIFYVNLYQNSAFTGSVANSYTYSTVSSAVYKQFTNTFNYSAFPSTNALSAYIGIYFSGTAVDGQGITIPQTGTWAIVDDLQLVAPTTTFVAIRENALNVNVEQIYPQPASEMVYMVYSLRESSASYLHLMDITGKVVKTIFTGEKQTPGRYKAELDMRELAQGVYFAKLTVGSEVRVSKIIKQ
ncbi:MAG TPA: T9SS type A sorting domain-containing protein, partial [Bacteroidia bacterium]|nr:T9SS type A sorting domain-containing protein [Bacteroidia bacterium]